MSSFSPMKGLALWTALMLSFIAFGAGARAANDGDIITNTAFVDFGIFTRRTNASNAVDTVIAVPPAPVSVPTLSNPDLANTGETTVLTITLSDATGIDTVLLDLTPLGRAESQAFRNDGVSPDSLAGDALWSTTLLLDTFILGDTYTLTIIFVDSQGARSETTITIAVTDASPSYAEMISLLQTGGERKRFEGNIISLVAEPNQDLARMLFEYRSAYDYTWRPVIPADTLPSPNPDVSGPPWSVLWDAADIADTIYLIRATGIRASGETDPSPSFIRVEKVSSNPTIEEWIDHADSTLVHRHAFHKTGSDTAWLLDGTYISIPQGGIAEDTVWIRVTTFLDGAPDDAPAPGAGSGLAIPGAGSYRRFVREDGLTTFPSAVVIGIPYDTGSGAVREDDLAIYRYDTPRGAWIRESGSSVDKEMRMVRVAVNHFTDFAVFGAAGAGNLAAVLVYPNPFVPYDNDDENGKPWTSGDNASGIIFANVTDIVDIDIYTAAGRLVSRFRASSTGGNVRWNARTDAGLEVASGVYLAILKSPSGEKVVRKLMVIR